MKTDDVPEPGRGTRIIILIAMVLAVVTAVGGFVAVYRATFVTL
ncbi:MULTISPECIES: hypothetical protein [Rhizobium]|nr:MULTISPECIES: hypothetical protein [Rhizobium]